MGSKNIKDQRNLLRSKEKKVLKDLEEETSVLEVIVRKRLKTAAIVGTSLAALILIYKLLDSDGSDDQAKASKKSKVKQTNDVTSSVTTSVIAVALQKLLPMLIDKLGTLYGSKMIK